MTDEAGDQLIISIHALHEESDDAFGHGLELLGGISIHALHEESDLETSIVSWPAYQFQSTLSMRRATRPANSRRRC